MVEELFVGGAEVAEGAGVGGEDAAVLETAALAKRAVAAGEAAVGGKAFAGGEALFGGAGGEPADGGFVEISQAAGGFDEEVAGEDVAVVLDDDVLVAAGAEGALRVAAVEVVAQEGVEEADADVFGAVGQPAVEEAAEEVGVLLGGNGEGGGGGGDGVEFDAGDELEVTKALVEEEVEEGVGLADVAVVEEDEDIELDAAAAAGGEGGEDAVEGAAAGGVAAVMVVEVAGAVETDAQEELVFGEEGAPGVVEEDGVGLEGVGDGAAGGAVFLLQLDGLAVEVEAQEHRLAALPGEGVDGQVEGEVVAGEGFEGVEGHAVAAGAEEVGLAGVEAVGAGEVAVGTGGLDEQAEVRHGQVSGSARISYRQGTQAPRKMRRRDAD